MTDIARMRFQSAKNPGEEGWLAIDSFGNLRVEPNDEMIEAIANLEQEAVEGTKRNSTIALSVLFGLGFLVAAAGWYIGRVTGRLRERLTTPRKVTNTPLQYAPEKGLRIVLNDGLFQVAQLTWAPGEYNSDEAEHFVETFERIKAAAAETR